MQLDHTSNDGIYQGKHVFSTLALQVWGLYLFDSTKKRLLIELVDHKWDILATIILDSVRNFSTQFRKMGAILRSTIYSLQYSKHNFANLFLTSKCDKELSLGQCTSNTNTQIQHCQPQICGNTQIQNC